jgi:thioredoxin-related protein
MLFKVTVAVYCENHTEHTDTVRTSQETHYVSATEAKRLMLLRETVAVYCESHTEDIDTSRTSQETHYVSATEAKRLMLFKETVSAYCEDLTQHTNALCGQNAKFLNAKASRSSCSYRCAVKGSRVNVRLCGTQQCS